MATSVTTTAPASPGAVDLSKSFPSIGAKPKPSSTAKSGYPVPFN